MVHSSLLGCLACWMSPVGVVDAWKLPMFQRNGQHQQQREQAQSPSSSSSSSSPSTKQPTATILATMAMTALEKSSEGISNALLNTRGANSNGNSNGAADQHPSLLLPFFNFYQVTAVSTFLQRFYEHLLAILLYKPPVGFVALLTTTRLITSGRLFRLYEKASSVEDNEDASTAAVQQRQRDSDRRGALILDPHDTAYQTAGGVDPIRQELCLAALGSSSTSSSRSSNSDIENPNDERSTTDSNSSSPPDLLQYVLRQTLQLQCRSSRLAFLHEASSKMAQLDKAAAASLVIAAPDSSKTKRTPVPLSSSSSLPLDVLEQAVQVCHVRVTDALLRVARDRLLLTTHRLGKTVAFWEKQVQLPKSRLRRWLFGDTGGAAGSSRMEQDRLRLAYASAAYQHEIRQLGIILQLLLDRPPNLPSSLLLQATKETKQQALLAEENVAGAGARAAVTSPPLPPVTPTSATSSYFLSLKDRFLAPDAISSLLSKKYYLRWHRNGTPSLLSVVRKWDGGQQAMDPTVAARILVHENDQMGWTKAAQEWTMLSRQSLCRIIRESLLDGNAATTRKPEQHHDLSIQDFEKSSLNLLNGLETSEAEWKRFLLYVDYLSQWQRVGEGQTIRIVDAVLNQWTRRVDIMGIPSTLLKIKVADWIHKAVLPHWPEFRQNTLVVVKKLVEILQQRVWVPLCGIWSELMNKSTGIMSGFGLQLEEQSLDNMLRDLGFGDGTAANRLVALQKAAEQYEHYLSGGVFVNLARGGLVRLLLVQVQQLKVGLISALDTIDVLLKGNQIHFQLLAAIPAVIGATYGTKFVLRFIYSIRSKDFRPITAAHSKMEGYLSHIERVILLDEPDKDMEQQQNHHLSPATLGEVSLYMYRYLSLLEYSSTLLPAASTEQIHLSLQELLGTTVRNDGSNDLTLRWLDRIKGQHHELLKHV